MTKEEAALILKNGTSYSFPVIPIEDVGKDDVIICRPEGMGDDSTLDRALHSDDKYGFC